MSLERITQHILDQAHEQARAELESTRRQTEGQLAEARLREEQALAEQLKDLEAALQREHQQETARARMEHRRELLRMKTDIMAKVFADATEKILASEPYRNWLRGKLAGLGTRSGRIVCRKEDRPVISGLLRELNLTGISFAEDGHPPRGGFILRTEKYDLDVTLEAELADLREELTGELVEQLTEGKADGASS